MGPYVEPAEAGLEVARRLGVGAPETEVVETGTHVLVRVEPGPVAARVTGDGIFAPFAGDLDAEVRLAAALDAAGGSRSGSGGSARTVTRQRRQPGAGWRRAIAR